MDGQTLINIGLVLVFVLMGGVFAATELALVSLRASQLAQLERRGHRGQRVAEVARDPNRFLAAVQIGVTVAGFFSAAYGGSTLAPDFAPTLEHLGLSKDAAEAVALIVITLVIAYLSLVLGELAPKRLALQRSASLSMLVAPTLDRFAALMRPIIWLLSASTNVVVRLVGGDPSATTEELSEDELRELVSGHQALDDHERRILSDVLGATETTVKEVMRPRGDVATLPADLPLPAAVERIRDRPFSRYPITGDNIDDVSGFLHVRDVIGVAPDDPRVVGDLSRRILQLPATNLILPTVGQMRQEGIHLAIVVDEYGGTDGIVTLEDLVEELVGSIRDEYDPLEAVGPTDGSSVDAGLSLADFFDATGIELAAGGYETAAGFVIARLGRIPDVGDTIEADGVGFEVAEMAGRRITRLKVQRVAAEADVPQDEAPESPAP